MRPYSIGVIALLLSGTASAGMPLFAARCTEGINVDSGSKGQVYVNGKVAKLINRPDGQITAQSAGIYIDITPQGSQAPRITYTAPDKTFGPCEILSFKAPDAGANAHAGAGHHRASSSERAGQGRFDAHGPVSCAMRPGQSLQTCQAAVARDGGGTATVVVTRPDGRTRAIYFENGKAIGADLSQADGSMHFRATRTADDMYVIEAGHERYEFIEAFVFGG
jgi:hypothetical protein